MRSAVPSQRIDPDDRATRSHDDRALRRTSEGATGQPAKHEGRRLRQGIHADAHHPRPDHVRPMRRALVAKSVDLVRGRNGGAPVLRVGAAACSPSCGHDEPTDTPIRTTRHRRPQAAGTIAASTGTGLRRSSTESAPTAALDAARRST